MAIEFPHCSCVGFDCADVFPMYSKPDNVDFKLGNLLDGLPFEDETFDVVNMRCVLCVKGGERGMTTALRKSEWPRVMAELYRVTKKGGLVQLTEFDMEFVSKDEVAKAFLERISLTLAGRGQDPTIATRLHRVIRSAGYICIARERWNGSLGDLMLESSRQAFIGSAPHFATVFALSCEDYILQLDDISERLKESKSYLNWYTALGRKDA
ncbi:hypothetical protein BC937DRAFT_86318 [Endogone sp. FLAS-F59071]|nr:hypothetical protein BC937DRAFT_86318 [Endogone sp. FLAS-F59071]|eukprot:RUS13116.1 hypothetical protein BC937DRAFT_86318 [Endogone sp. FLAS-F59071]